jgi:hypothetical protein
MQDNGESDVDCGGNHCVKCANDQKCNNDSDCISDNCPCPPDGGACNPAYCKP